MNLPRRRGAFDRPEESSSRHGVSVAARAVDDIVNASVR